MSLGAPALTEGGPRGLDDERSGLLRAWESPLDAGVPGVGPGISEPKMPSIKEVILAVCTNGLSTSFQISVVFKLQEGRKTRSLVSAYA